MSKKKKEKIIYYDDNSTIADMSNVTRSGKKKPPKPQKVPVGESKWQTYWSAVRMMFVPMFFVLGILGILFLLMMAITGNLF